MVDFFFYLTIASAGFWSLFDHTPVIVLERVAKDGSKDIPGVIGIIGIIISIFVAYPCSWNPTRSQVCMLIWKTEEFNQKTNFIMTTIFVSFTWFIAYIFPKVNQIMSILGGLCAVTLDYGIPTFCFVSMSKKAWNSSDNLWRIIFFGFLNLAGFVGVGVTVYEMITGCDRLAHSNEDECPKANKNSV